MTRPIARLCARPGCGRYADRVVKLHRDDGHVGVIHVCEEDAAVLAGYSDGAWRPGESQMNWYRLNADHTISGPYDPRDPAEPLLQTPEERRVAHTEIGTYRVSTVFLGLDHSPTGDRSELFETMVFGADSWLELLTRRYATWDDAVAGHAAVVAEVIAHASDATEARDET